MKYENKKYENRKYDNKNSGGRCNPSEYDELFYAKTFNLFAKVESTIYSLTKKVLIMKTRFIRTVNSKRYVLAASVENKSLWLNRIKTTARRKTLAAVWS